MQENGSLMAKRHAAANVWAAGEDRITLSCGSEKGFESKNSEVKYSHQTHGFGYFQVQILEGLGDQGASVPQARSPLLLLGLSDEEGQGYGGEDEGSRSCSRRHSSSVHKHNGYHAGADTSSGAFPSTPPLAISSSHTLIYRFDTPVDTWAFITSGRRLSCDAGPWPQRRSNGSKSSNLFHKSTTAKRGCRRSSVQWPWLLLALKEM